MATNRKRKTAPKKSAGLTRKGSRMNVEAAVKVPPAAQQPRAEAGMRKMIIVHDASGKIVSVTRVAPGARHGVGVVPNPGHTVKEVDVPAGAEELRPGNVSGLEFDVKRGRLKTGR